jgi:hypothetical protein
METINVGVIGLGQRGSMLLSSIMASPEARIVAVSDLYQDRIERAQKIVVEAGQPEPKAWTNWKDLVEDPHVQVVVVVSNWDTHIPMALYAMRKNKVVASEVAGAYSLQDCWDLVNTYEETKTPIMMMENCCFDEFELLTTSLVRAGKLGNVVYCHGAYGHDLRKEITGGRVNRHYRLENYLHRNCENYPTHEIGPIAKILDINRGNRFVSLSSLASPSGVSLDRFVYDSRCPDPTLKGKHFDQADVVASLLKTERGELVSLRLDTSLPRFYAREFTIRGTAGMALGDINGILLEDKTHDIAEVYETPNFIRSALDTAKAYQADYEPECWKNITPLQRTLGHGGMDYIEFRVLFDCLLAKKPFPIDVYDMASWMAITPLSEESIKQGGAPMAFPDFTRGAYRQRPEEDVVALPGAKR